MNIKWKVCTADVKFPYLQYQRNRFSPIIILVYSVVISTIHVPTYFVCEDCNIVDRK